jgi:hypothetical protein
VKLKRVESEEIKLLKKDLELQRLLVRNWKKKVDELEAALQRAAAYALHNDGQAQVASLIRERDDWKLRYETRADGLREKLVSARTDLATAEGLLRAAHKQIQETQTILAGPGDSDPRDLDVMYLRTGIRHVRGITSKLVDVLGAFLNRDAPKPESAKDLRERLGFTPLSEEQQQENQDAAVRVEPEPKCSLSAETCRNVPDALGCVVHGVKPKCKTCGGTRKWNAGLEGDGEMSPPKRRFDVQIGIGGDTWEDVLCSLRHLSEHLEEHGPTCNSAGGGPSAGHHVQITEDPTMTHERYHEAVESWLQEKRDGKSGGES